ncbi:hypothetical protein F5148DRAFT_984014 [Russula earlei]|uniref:Uncharacterized protein n=1 Tax=Russula earlei TaxID=71964 RepID=A0ACC0U1X8_9AGAM|nr:hypothetical protein F5148DRAFT_984014 [Russula earlei]
MSVLPRFLVPLAIFLSLLPSVMAQGSNCQSHEFWYDKTACCVPKHVPQSPSRPPPGKSCPTSDTETWYWSDNKSCCLPNAPPPPSKPTPTCQNGHSWNVNEGCCSAPPPSGPQSCSNDQFWYQPKNTCLPKGGPPNRPQPPVGRQCPQVGWYWDVGSKCCLPYHRNQPPPQCPSGWEWNSSSHHNHCQLIPTPPSPQPLKPSYYRHMQRRQKLRVDTLCPNEMTACPIYGIHGPSDYECIDPMHELQSCGGCSSTGTGQDCTAIRGAWNVGCEAGHCAVYNCMRGYKLARNGSACIPL